MAGISTEVAYSPDASLISAAPVAAPETSAQIVADYPPAKIQGGTFLYIPCNGEIGPQGQLQLDVATDLPGIARGWLPILPAGVPFRS